MLHAYAAVGIELEGKRRSGRRIIPLVGSMEIVARLAEKSGLHQPAAGSDSLGGDCMHAANVEVAVVGMDFPDFVAVLEFTPLHYIPVLNLNVADNITILVDLNQVSVGIVDVVVGLGAVDERCDVTLVVEGYGILVLAGYLEVGSAIGKIPFAVEGASAVPSTVR